MSEPTTFAGFPPQGSGEQSDGSGNGIWVVAWVLGLVADVPSLGTW